MSTAAPPQAAVTLRTIARVSAAPPLSDLVLWRPTYVTQPHRRLRHVLRIAYTVARVFLAVALLAGWFAILRPTSLGGPASYVLVSGCSMCPTYSPGDLIMTMHHDTYAVGDIVAYRVPAPDPAAGQIVIHRIAAITPVGYTMRGDHNTWSDPWLPKPRDVVGTAVVRLPAAGVTLQLVRSPALLSALAATLAFCVIAFGAKRSRA